MPNRNYNLIRNNNSRLENCITSYKKFWGRMAPVFINLGAKQCHQDTQFSSFFCFAILSLLALSSGESPQSCRVARCLLKFCVSCSDMQHWNEESKLSLLCVSHSEETFLGGPSADVSPWRHDHPWTSTKSLRSRVGILPWVGQIQPATCFCTAWELTMAFLCAKGWKSQQKNILWDVESTWNSNFSAQRTSSFNLER